MLLFFKPFSNYLFLSIIVILSIRESWAHEFISFVDKKCRIYSGLVAHVDESSFILWELHGGVKNLRRENIEGIFVFNTSKNPFSSMKVSDQLRPFFRKISFEEEGNSFVGWPYKFIEDLIFFISTEGQRYVVAIDQIKLIDKLKEGDHLRFSQARRVPAKIDLAPYYSRCFKTQKRNQSLRPHHVVIGKIKVFEFFKDLEEGFNNVSNLRERTQVYPRPYVFEKKRRGGRLGFHRFDSSKGRDRERFIPLYFQWTTGKDFHFQGRTTLGAHYTKWTPNVDPIGVLSSELKSHFFNIIFVGNYNPTLIPVGLRVSRAVRTGTSKLPQLSPHLNYLALMGADWKQFSLSAGPYYPSFVLTVNDEMRELLSTKASPMIRFQYTKKDWALRVLYSQTNYLYPTVNFNEHLHGDGTIYENRAKSFKEVSFKNRFLRLGLDYTVDEDTTVGIDEVIMKGKYKELIGPSTNNMDFLHLYTSAYAERDFGHYVFLRVVGNFYSFKYDYKMGEKNDSTKDSLLTMGVVLGLLF